MHQLSSSVSEFYRSKPYDWKMLLINFWKMERLNDHNKKSFLNCTKNMDWSRPGAPGGAFRGHAPKSLLVPPQAKSVPLKRGLCPERKKQARCHWSAYRGLFLKKILLVPPSVSKISFQKEKHEWTPRLSLRFCAEDFFWSSLLNLWPRSEIPTIRFYRTPPGNERAPLSPSNPKQDLFPERRKTARIKIFFFGLLSRRWR